MGLIEQDVNREAFPDFNGDYRVFFNVKAGRTVKTGLQTGSNDMDQFMIAFNTQYTSDGLVPVLGTLGANLNVAVDFAEQFEREFNATFE